MNNLITTQQDLNNNGFLNLISEYRSVETRTNTLAGKFMELSKDYETSEAFLEAVGIAEEQYKTKRNASKQDASLPKSWRQAKSDINAWFKTGNATKEFATYSQLKKELNATRKAAKDEKVSEKQAKEGESQPTNSAQDFLVAALLEKLGGLPDGLRDEMLNSFIAQTDSAKQANDDGVIEVQATVVQDDDQRQAV